MNKRYCNKIEREVYEDVFNKCEYLNFEDRNEIIGNYVSESVIYEVGGLWYNSGLIKVHVVVVSNLSIINGILESVCRDIEKEVKI